MSSALARLAIPADVREILLWHNMKKSGICFGGSTAVYLLLAWAPISFSVLGLQALTVSSLSIRSS